MSGKILVVDDSLTVRMNLMDMLDAADLPAEACATLAEARDALAKNRFSLVILDVLLPDGDGVQLLEEIRATPSASGTAVMLLSTEAEIRDRIARLGPMPVADFMALCLYDPAHGYYNRRAPFGAAGDFDHRPLFEPHPQHIAAIGFDHAGKDVGLADKVGDEGAGGGLINLARRPDLQHASLVHDRDAV